MTCHLLRLALGFIGSKIFSNGFTNYYICTMMTRLALQTIGHQIFPNMVHETLNFQTLYAIVSVQNMFAN